MPRDGSGAAEEKPDAAGAPRSAVAELAESLSPVDLPDPPSPLPHGLRWTSLVIAWAALVLALLNAHALRSWSYQLPPNAASAPVVSAAETWFDSVDRAGLNRPVEAMHGWWQAARGARFKEEEIQPHDGRPGPIEGPPQAIVG